MADSTNTLDTGALKGFDPNANLFPDDRYQGEIKKISNSEKGTTVVCTITDYQGTKEEGLKAIGKEISVFINTKFDEKTPNFIKEQSLGLMYDLCNSLDITPGDPVEEETLKGRIVIIAAKKRKDQYGRFQMGIVHFDKA